MQKFTGEIFEITKIYSELLLYKVEEIVCISRSLRRFAITSRMAKFTAGIICLRMFSIVTRKIP